MDGAEAKSLDRARPLTVNLVVSRRFGQKMEKNFELEFFKVLMQADVQKSSCRNGTIVRQERLPKARSLAQPVVVLLFKAQAGGEELDEIREAGSSRPRP